LGSFCWLAAFYLFKPPAAAKAIIFAGKNNLISEIAGI
jgi:hypothetical protein